MSVDYREKYKFLKRKLKILVYEHEALTQELEKSQRKLLKVARDKSFLLDRLLQYEQVAFDSPADSDVTLSSDSDSGEPATTKKKIEPTKSAKTAPQSKDDMVKPATEPAENKELDVKEEYKEVDSPTDQTDLPTVLTKGRPVDQKITLEADIEL